MIWLWWLMGAVLIGPLVVLPPAWGIDGFQAKNAGFILLGLLGVLWSIPNGWLRAFGLWAILSFLAAGATAWALAGLLGLLAWFVVYTAAFRLTAGWSRVRWAITGAVVIQLAWMVLQTVNADPLFVPVTIHGEPQPAVPMIRVGWFTNPMDAALFLGMSLPILPPWLALVTVGVLLVGLQSTAGALAAIGWLVWRVSLSTRWPKPLLARLLVAGALAGVAGSLLLVYGLVLDSQGPNVKPTIWRSAIHVVNAKPWIGWGPNAVDYRVIMQTTDGLRWNFVFNEWLQGALEFGWMAPALALGYLVTLIRRAWGRVRWSDAHWLALGILLAWSLFSIPFRIGPVALLAALYLGRLDGLARETTR